MCDKFHTKLMKLIFFRVVHLLPTIKKKKESFPYPLKASDKIILHTCLMCDQDLDFGQCITSPKFRRNLLFPSSASKRRGRDSFYNPMGRRRCCGHKTPCNVT